MSTGDMLSWVDLHITEIGKLPEQYLKSRDIADLQELRRAVSILQALTEELIIRAELLIQ